MITLNTFKPIGSAQPVIEFKRALPDILKELEDYLKEANLLVQELSNL